MTRPNILQIVVDDMGYGDLSSVNFGASSTPVLDQLSADGTNLTQHYSASPVCAPARAALLTGRYPQRVGVIDTLEAYGTDRLTLEATTLADELSATGYATGVVGKWHSGAIDPRYHPTARGFREFVGFRGGWQDYWSWTIEAGGATVPADGRYLTDVFTDAAIDFLRRHRSEPFYLHLAYNAPHFPFQAPADDIDRFLAAGFTRAVATIYAMIQRVDTGIGRILQLLDDLGLADNTLVMFVSDNGPQLDGTGEESTVRYNAGFHGEKGTVWEGGIRVPAILRWPDGLASRRSHDDLAHFTDWAPTILELADIRTSPERFDGRSLLPMLRDERRDLDRTRFWQWTRYHPMPTSNAAMRDGDWKLVWPVWPGTLDALPDDVVMDERIKAHPEEFPEALTNPAPPDPLVLPDAQPALFNLRDDPAEAIDLAAEHPKRLAAMRRALEVWYDEVEAERRSLPEQERTRVDER